MSVSVIHHCVTNYSKQQWTLIISHVFYGPGIGEQLSWGLPAWGLGGVVFHEVTVKVSAGTAVIGGLDWDRRLYFQAVPLAGQARRCWLLLGGLGSSARAAAPVAAGFAQRKLSQSRAEAVMPSDLTSEVVHGWSFLQYPMGYTSQTYSVWAGTV